jgi:predicted nucleic acid-binding protein
MREGGIPIPRDMWGDAERVRPCHGADAEPGADRSPAQCSLHHPALTSAHLGPSHHQLLRARRQDRLQRTEAVFDPLPFDVEAARAYGRVHAAVVEQGRQPRPRFADLLIASAALAEQLPLITRNADDVVGLESLITVVEI